ncbi:MAG: DUF3318 domain-containing protein [Gloeomargaritaceae cyanobacterium C42_A2020_066]|nr:DUF3318 domain-containing protein [Gloeomargaritaceae cyanobacterium C42_A2020_066]
MPLSSPTADAYQGEFRRLQSLLPPEMRGWVTVAPSTGMNPPVITAEEIDRDQVEVQVDLVRWDQLALDQRNLLFWHEVARIQSDTLPKEGWEMAALAIGLGGAVGELWVQDTLLLLLSLGLAGFSGYRLWQRNQKQNSLEILKAADERALELATQFGYTLPNAYKSLGSALKVLIDQTPDRRQRRRLETRLDALRRSAARAKARSQRPAGPSYDT